MGLKFLSIFAFYAIFCIHHNVPSVDALIGEATRPAERDEIPFIVSFMHYNPENPQPTSDHFCAGTLISRQHVLSSEQCIVDKDITRTIILAGTNNLIYGRLYFLMWWVTYDQWAHFRRRRPRFGNNNLSITKLYQEVDQYIPYASISNLGYRDFQGIDAFIAGWGRNNNGLVSETLLMGKVRVIMKSDCESRINRLDESPGTIDVRYFCTVGNPYLLLHDGDYGGPLIVLNKLAGVSVDTRPFSNNQFHSEKVNVHVSIDYFRAFIVDVTTSQFSWR